MLHKQHVLLGGDEVEKVSSFLSRFQVRRDKIVAPSMQICCLAGKLKKNKKTRETPAAHSTVAPATGNFKFQSEIFQFSL